MIIPNIKIRKLIRICCIPKILITSTHANKEALKPSYKDKYKYIEQGTSPTPEFHNMSGKFSSL